MKIFVIGDIHGRSFWKEVYNFINKVDRIVFLGDYLDPYPQEGISWNETIENFREILQLKEQYPNKIILLLGNHDCQYLIPEFMNCSRRNYFEYDNLQKLFQNNIDKFQLIYELDNYLFCHAPIREEWMDDFTLEDLKNYKTFITEHWKTLEQVSFWRGGDKDVGSCIWSDIREGLPLYTDKIQIVGHTQLLKPYTSKNLWCLDCRQCFIIDEDGLKEL